MKLYLQVFHSGSPISASLCRPVQRPQYKILGVFQSPKVYCFDLKLVNFSYYSFFHAGIQHQSSNVSSSVLSTMQHPRFSAGAGLVYNPERSALYSAFAAPAIHQALARARRGCRAGQASGAQEHTPLTTTTLTPSFVIQCRVARLPKAVRALP